MNFDAIVRGGRVTLILLALAPLTTFSQQSEAVRSYPVPEGEIRGIVLDAITDVPLAGVRLTLDADKTARTDAQGRFVIRGVQHGSYTLSAHKTGYELGRVSVQMVPVVGWAARFSLRIDPNQEARICEMVCGTYCNSVAVVVRDVLTGRAPISPVALRVTDADSTYWDLGSAESGDSALKLYAGRGPGPFHVEVVAGGYSPWRLAVPIVETDRCGIPVQKPRQAWLLREYSVDPARHYLPPIEVPAKPNQVPP